jgi:2-hydroxyacyl-CoA lyase 1
MQSTQLPMNYHSAYRIIKRHIKPEDMLVAEGANTMDIGRTIFMQARGKTKLDAATFGTMGIGLPSIIAAKTVNPGRRVVATLGDSAFGFSAMECETLTRYGLGAIIFVINNNGIFTGCEELPGDRSTAPVTALNPATRYEKIAEAFGGVGLEARNHEELEQACEKAFSAREQLVVVNVRIDPYATKMEQTHSWLTKSKL